MASSPHSQASTNESPPHARSVERVLSDLATPEGGLDRDEVERRRARHGANRLPRQRTRGPLRRFAVQFHDALIYVLLVAAAVTAALRQWVDTGAILGVVLINAVIGFVQEGRAERALAAIRGLLSPRARVRRQGRPVTIDAAELVPGDIVVLSGGDKVPADLRLTRARNLRIDEAALTGESEPADKDPAAVAADRVLAERPCMAFSGTLVSTGEGEGVVVATGAATVIGGMTAMLAGVEQVATPLTRQMRRFGRRLTAAIVSLAAAVFALAVTLQAYAWTEAFLAAVGLAVAAIPQGLPAIMTITLAVGVQAMARRRAVIRRMHAAETLGSVDTICSDKTGTLTRNEMTVTRVVLAGYDLRVTGVGYAPDGEFERDERPIEPGEAAPLVALARAGLLCNDAAVERDASGEWRLDGDPTEGALVTLARKAGLEPEAEAAAAERLDAIPFASESRYMATLHGAGAGERRILVKGASERILEMCAGQVTADGVEAIDIPGWHERAEAIAAEGLRVLAIARLAAADDRSGIEDTDVQSGLELLGLVGLIDPPREEAVAAVAQCRDAGIRVKMITGDHGVTARAIAAGMGIGDGTTVLTGRDLDQLGDDELRERTHAVDVFARVSPEHKLRLVQALQAGGEVVAMTGDGVNDAAALKRADVGVAMGRKGTEVAKEAAEIVLTDDNFASIVAAVRLGRTAYDNIKRSVLFLLPTNGGEGLAIVTAVLVGMQLPITPVQILWVNMITAATLGLSLAFEPGDPGVMRRPPRPPNEPLVSLALVRRIVLVALLMLFGTFGFYGALREAGVELELARTAAVNALVLFEVFYLFSARLLNRRLRHVRELGGNRVAWLSIAIVIGLQLLFTYSPWMQLLFGTAAMPGWYWAVLVPLAAGVVLVVELEKVVLDRRRGGRSGDSPREQSHEAPG